MGASCERAPEFPTKTVWEVDLQNQVCGEYEIVNSEKLEHKHVKDWPMEKCQGVFGFSTEDTPKVMEWAEDIQTYGKEHCK